MTAGAEITIRTDGQVTIAISCRIAWDHERRQWRASAAGHDDAWGDSVPEAVLAHFGARLCPSGPR